MKLPRLLPLILLVGAGAMVARIHDLASTATAAPAASPAQIDTRLGASLDEDMNQQQRALADRARQLEMRERLLEASTKRVEVNSSRPETAPNERDQARMARDEAEANILQLVKIYQAMKPREAARIMEQLDIDIQVAVASRMRDRAMAGILGSMSPEAATKLTTALARPGRLMKVATAQTRP